MPCHSNAQTAGDLVDCLGRGDSATATHAVPRRRFAMEDKDWKGNVLAFGVGGRNSWSERYLWVEDGSMQMYKSDIADRPMANITLEQLRGTPATSTAVARSLGQPNDALFCAHAYPVPYSTLAWG